MKHKKNKTILRIRGVCKKTGLSKATIYRQVKVGKFPKPRRIGERAVGWLEYEIEEFAESRPKIDL
jgi:prophage regulatory protein